ncbi:plasmid mobilization protein [Slackia exigua]|uniref:plasmid mobilization protein n=1 Tax=Slackia exigua TaxID=84109 RepID=UPI002004AEE1|nr:mobilization protein [Slackia exigua]MCK6139729.1 mobilization protein [Slackia exigua]
MAKELTDSQGRRRSVTVAFRVSPEEADLIDRLVDASGMTKQDYITGCLEEHAVVVVPSTRMQRGMSRQMDYAYRELRRMHSASELPPELITLLERLTN